MKPRCSTPTRRGPGRPRDDALTARRQDEILCKAASVFAEHGYRQTDVQAIADGLGLAKGTIYRYFNSKECLFLATVDKGMRCLSERVNAAADEADDSLLEIEHAICAYLAFFDEHPHLVELLIQERAEFKDRKKPTYFEHRDANIGRWQRLISHLIEEGRIRRAPVDRVLDVISDLLYGTIFTNHFAGRRRSLEQQAADILDVIFHGILSERERAQRCSEKG